MAGTIGSGKQNCRWMENVTKTMDFTTKYCGSFKVFVQGTEDKGKPAFLTVHDIGVNHVPFCDFVASKAMVEVARHSTWYHVCLPGQNHCDEQLPDDKIYPTMDAIAHDLLEILEVAKLPVIIGFGEGAGANILLRFGLMYSKRCLGLILIDGSGSAASVDEKLNNTFTTLWESGRKLFDRFRGVKHHDGQQPIAAKSSLCNAENLVNVKNVELYAKSFAERTDINKFLATDLNTDCLIVTARESPNKEICEEQMTHMNKKRTTLLVVDEAVDVLYENQQDLVRNLILFCKGCGVLIGVPMVGLEHEFQIVRDQELHKGEQTEAQKEIRRQIKLFEAMLFEKD